MNLELEKRDLYIALLAIATIVAHLLLRFGFTAHPWVQYPLYLALVFGGTPLVVELCRKALNKQFGSDLLAGISIITSVLLGEYLAGVLVVLMLSGGEAIEAFAVRRASSVLDALARRMPSTVHRRRGKELEEIPLTEVTIGDLIEVFPHEICPVDGTVVEGHGSMDESYLTGEPYNLSKTPGAQVISGSINGESTLCIRADTLVHDSRYAKIMAVMKESEQQRPMMRRLGDQLGAWYTPVALCIAIIAWSLSGDPLRFLAVLVVATPCPLLIAIPTAIVGAISLSARRGIIIRNPAILEQIGLCKTIIFDKTGTLTYGKPLLVEQHIAPGFNAAEILQLVASLERYSKHPLAVAVLDEFEKSGAALRAATSISEKPGEGLLGHVDEFSVRVTSRNKHLKSNPQDATLLPEQQGGLECVILVNERYAATYQFRDQAREDGRLFIEHLLPHHGFQKILLVSGDRESEVRYLAKQVGIEQVYYEQSPEQKLEIVKQERTNAPTIFIGDGINDAPALTAATAGIALGQNSDITAEAADAIILDLSLRRIDEFLHISKRMRTIALQSAVGGMALSILGMFFAAAGLLPPVAGAVTQEIIDVFAVLNAVRVAFPPSKLSDF